MPESRVFRWANYASTTLNGAINNSTTTVVVADGSIFPALAVGEICTVVLRDDALGKFEIMNITSRSGNTLTVERGAEGTTAQAWASGHTMSHSLTAAWFQSRGYSVPTPVVQYVDSLCSYTVTGSSPLSFALPAGAQVGDFLLLAITLNGAAETVTPPTGWTMLSMTNTGGSSDDYHLKDVGSATALFAYRFMQLGDTAVNITITGGVAGSFKAGGCIHAFRGVDTDRPVPQMVMNNIINNSSDSGFNTALHTPVMNSVAFGSRALAFAYSTPTVPTIYNGQGTFCVQPTEFFEAADKVDGGNAHGFLSMVFAPDQNEFENLLNYTFRNFNSWTKTGITTVNDADGTNPVKTRVDPGFSAGPAARHELSQVVTLTAGVSYSLTLFAATDNSSNTDDLFISIDDGGGAGRGEIGASYDKATNNWANTGNLPAGGFDYEYGRKVGQPGSATSINHAIGVVFVPTVTGSHTIRIGYTLTAGSPTSTAAATNDGGYLWQAILAEGHFLSPAWRELGTAGAPVTEVNGMAGRVVRSFIPSTAQTRIYQFEIRAAGQTPDLVRLHQGVTADCEFKSGRLGIADTGPSGNNNVTACATGCVDKLQNAAAGKFYYEVTCGPTNWESAASDETYVGFAVPWVRGAFRSALGSAMTPNQQGMMVYGNNGNVYYDGTLVATIATPTATYTSGDVVGAGIDFTANEIKFYKNGSLVYTASLAAVHLNIPIRAVVISTGTASRGREVTANFAGPFSFLPSGYSAYDWENS